MELTIDGIGKWICRIRGDRCFTEGQLIGLFLAGQGYLPGKWWENEFPWEIFWQMTYINKYSN